MARYEIIVAETLRKSVQVEAGSWQEAREKAEKMYYGGEIVLFADDYFETEFEIIKLDGYDNQD